MLKRNMTIVVLGLLLFTAVFLPVWAVPSTAEANPGEERGVVSVYGEAALTAQPDTALVTLAVETTHESAKIAAEENARLTNAVLEALTKSGLDKKQVKTSGYRLSSYTQQIDPQDKEKYVTKFRAYNELNINLHDLEHVGNVIDTAIKAGANKVLSILFELQNAEALKLQALQNATMQAKAKATAIARSAGTSVKGIKVIQEEMSGYFPYRAAVMEESAKTMALGAPTPVLPGDVEVTARIRAEYYLN